MPVRREQRFVFGEVAETYDRSRPGYPRAAFEMLLAGIPERPVIVEIGAGTGKASRELAARGGRLIAIEPVPEMAAVARRNLEGFPNAEVVETTFEEWPDRGMEADLVVCAQAWHWLDQSVALAKAAQLLRNGGRLALMWNAPEFADREMGRALDAIYEAVTPSLEGGRPWQRLFPEVVAAVAGAGQFSTPVRGTASHEVAYTAAEYCDLMRTQSDHRLLDPGVQERLITALEAEIGRRGGRVSVRYETVVLTMERRMPS